MGFANAAMLLGLIGVGIPVLIHLLSRRRVPTIEWGAMQFLDLGRRARARVRISEWLLMAARMLLLALVALAAARPLLRADGGSGGTGGPRNIVLIFDRSASMGRQGGGTTPRDQAIRWAHGFVDRLRPGDSVAVVLAGAHARPVLDPPRVDRDRIRAAIDALPPPAGTSDLPAAIGEAFRILEQTRHPRREVIVLTDGQRLAWRPGDRGRWRLLHNLYEQMPVPPRMASETFTVEIDLGAADGAVSDVVPSRRIVATGATVTVEATIHNAGPAPLRRSASLGIDGKPVPGSSRSIGPVSAGGSASVRLDAVLNEPGSHALSVRLEPGPVPDPLPINDEAAVVVEVAGALPVLLVNGEPGLEPLSGEVDFLRTALAPTGDESPQITTSTIEAAALGPDALTDHRVLVLANVDRLSTEQVEAVAVFLDRGGGVLVAPGDQTEADAWNAEVVQNDQGWLPARLGPMVGSFSRRQAIAHPAPSSFLGPILGPFGRGDAPPLADAGLFAYWLLTPADASDDDGSTGASILGRLDSGDPWIVAWPVSKGRVVLLAGPLDAEGGTLPANPDFVPLLHEFIYELAGTSIEPEPIRPGDRLAVPLDPPPPNDVTTIPARLPSGRIAHATVDRSGAEVVARLDSTDEPGLYRFDLPDPASGFAYQVVLGDDREADPAPLRPAEAEALAEGWPLTFDLDPDSRDDRRSDSIAGGSPRPLWRGLVLAALAGLCLELWLTRRLALTRGLEADSGRSIPRSWRTRRQHHAVSIQRIDNL